MKIHSRNLTWVRMYKMADIYTFVVSGNVGTKGDCLLFIVLD